MVRQAYVQNTGGHPDVPDSPRCTDPPGPKSLEGEAKNAVFADEGANSRSGRVRTIGGNNFRAVYKRRHCCRKWRRLLLPLNGHGEEKPLNRLAAHSWIAYVRASSRHR